MLEKRVLKRAPQPTDLHVGRRIRTRRRALRISQATLGGAVGVAFQQIQKYENGTNRIGAGRLQQIAEALDCHPAWFFEDAPAFPRGGRAAAQSDDFVLSAFLADAQASDIARRFAHLPPRIKRALAELAAAVVESLEQLENARG
jgi:transcriptional regulator with XRE-family HTH domain